MYFFDTNILLKHLDKVKQLNKFYISSVTLEELEDIKSSGRKTEDVRYAARRAVRFLNENDNKFECVIYGVDIPEEENVNNDDKIIMCCCYVRTHESEPVAFVTDDMLCKLIAQRKFNIPVESWVNSGETIYKGYKEITGTSEQINDYLSHYNVDDWNINEYLIINNTDDGSTKEMRFDGTGFVSLKLPPSKYIKGKNALQRCALDALMNFGIVAILGNFGSGKAVPNSTKIPTPYGYKRMGDIKVGDLVFDENGNPTPVTGVFPQGKIDNYKVTFSDGRSAYCNDEHIWTCYTSKKHLKNVTVREMLDTGLYTETHSVRYKIPRSKAVQYDEKKYEIDPYVIGSFLGNGCCREKPLTMSSNDEEQISEVARLIGCEYTKNSGKNYSWVFKKNGKPLHTKEFFADYPTLLNKYSFEKSIPEEYKYGSIKQRYELLQGLMDTDGHIDNAVKGRTSYSSTSYQLIKDIQEICWSLGMSATIRVDNREKNKHVCYDLGIACNREEKSKLFRLTRKRSIAVLYGLNNAPRTKNKTLSITNIEKMPEQEEMTCILVGNDSHLFLTEQFLVTHNTYLATKMGLYHVLEKGSCAKMVCVRETRGEGEQQGYLPGSLEEKIAPFNFPIAQQLDGGEWEMEKLKSSGQLEFQVPYYMKGTTYNETVMVVDEAEDLKEQQIRLIGTRIGANSKLFFVGDYRQSVINKTTDNALIRMCNELKGDPDFACVCLEEDVRSSISKKFAYMFTKD
jgi:predicted ribonuclease YlaK